jgi:hypothetical protein
MLTKAKKKSQLSVLDNWELLISYFSKRNNVDVHSGYFSGKFALNLISGLTGLGWSGYLKSQGGGGETMQSLNEFSQKCADHQIRVLVSPERIS